MAETPDRKAPCPCGSGKKYKNCCWAAHAATTPKGRIREFRSIERELMERIVAWGERRVRPSWLRDEAARLELKHQESLQIVLPWLAFHAEPKELGGRSVGAGWLADEGAAAPPDLRIACEAHLQGWISMWQVAGDSRAPWLVLEDLLTGEKRRLLEPEAHQVSGPGALLCCRVVEFEGIPVLGGLHDAGLPRPPDPAAAEALATELRGHLAEKGVANLSPESLRREAGTLAVLEFWDGCIEALSVPQDPPPDDAA